MAKLTGAVAPKSQITAIPYPGRTVKRGFDDRELVKNVQRRLNETGCGPIDEDGDFGDNTERAVKLFQARFTDADGTPLIVDGRIGPITWERLFGVKSTPTTDRPDAEALLPAKAMEIAISQIGTMERPLGSNRGPQVDKYLRSVGLNPAKGSYPWCAAFLYWCFEQAAGELGRNNPLVKTAGVLDHWAKAGAERIPRIPAAQAHNNPSLVKPGQIFIMDYGGGAGHTGLIEKVVGGKLITIEGNTNDGGSREGIGVFRREGRKIISINKGFIDYGTL